VELQVNTLGIAKIRSYVDTGQYACSVPSDHSQGQALLESLLLPGSPGIPWINDFSLKGNLLRKGLSNKQT